MSIRITDQRITSDETAHYADWSPDAAADGQGAWIVSWLPGRRLLTRNQAITAMTLAETVNGDDRHAHRMQAHVDGWAAELGLAAAEAAGLAKDPKPAHSALQTATGVAHLGAARFPDDHPHPRYDPRAGFPTAPSTTTVGGSMTTKDPRQAEHIREASDRLREIGRRLPRWRPGTINGRHVLVDDALGWELAELRSPWTPDLIEFYAAINGTTLCALAELLWNVSRGDVRSVVTGAEQLIEWMGLGPNGRRPRGGPFHSRTDVDDAPSREPS